MSLAGKTVVVTRAWHQVADFVQKLERAQAKVLLYPCVDIVPPINPDELDRGVAKLMAGEFDWLLLTSQNTVLALASRIRKLPKNTKVAAIGPATAQAARSYLHIDAAVPEIYDAQSLAQWLPKSRGMRVFLPQADIAQPLLQKQLEQAGALVEVVAAYCTVMGSGGDPLLPHLRRGEVDVVTFASPSAVRFFMQRLKNEGGTIDDLTNVCIACIGHVTQRAALSEGLTVDVAPKVHTLDAMIAEFDKLGAC